MNEKNENNNNKNGGNKKKNMTNVKNRSSRIPRLSLMPRVRFTFETKRTKERRLNKERTIIWSHHFKRCMLLSSTKVKSTKRTREMLIRVSINNEKKECGEIFELPQENRIRSNRFNMNIEFCLPKTPKSTVPPIASKTFLFSTT